MKLSVIIPARQEPLLQKTINSLLDASELGGGLEVIAVLDGPCMEPPNGGIRVKTVRLPEERGMRAAINAGLVEADGKYVCKVDAHCMFAPGFDKKMVECCEDNWLTIPRRYALDDVKWGVIKDKHPRDYHYLCYPHPDPVMAPQVWNVVGWDDTTVDDTLTFQGSCWVANRKYFMDHVNLLDDREETYGSFAAEQLEVGLKYWLGGGQVKVNKDTWYAHLWKKPRHYVDGKYTKKPTFKNGWQWATKHWLGNNEPGMKYKFEWLMEKFWPVPGWPEERQEWNLKKG